MNRSDLTSAIKQKALQLDFDVCGLAKAERLDKESVQLKDWLNKKMHAGMTYMENHFEMRVDPETLWPGAKSVLVVALNYFPGKVKWGNSEFEISRYALGNDYHDVLRDKLKLLLEGIQSIEPSVLGRTCVDSAPILEKIWAQKAGLGWQGKNSLLLTNKNGSYVFLGIILLNIDLDYDSPETDHCGSCHKCLVACPTHAIVSPGVIDSNKCISYHTIERKDSFESGTPIWEKWIFGCDICQEVCPYNHDALLTKVPEFFPRKEITELTSEEWIKLDEVQYKKIFRKSPVKRAKFTGLKRNINRVISSSK